MKQFDLIIRKSSAEDNAKKIADTIALGFSGENGMLPYIERVIKILPELQGVIYKGMDYDGIYARVEDILTWRLTEAARPIQEKVKRFEYLVHEKLTEAVEQLQEIFELQYADKQVYHCYLGFYNPFPRSVLTREYWLHYDISDEVFLRASLHEINHMILFDKWKSLHGYEEKKEPDYPDILWLLEELAIEPTLNDQRIQRIIPIRHEAYESLKAIEVGGKPITLHIQEIYDASGNIRTFLEESYYFLQNHCAGLL